MRIRLAVTMLACMVTGTSAAWGQSSQTSFTITAIVGGDCSAEMQQVEKIGQHLKVHFSRSCHKPHAIKLATLKGTEGTARVMYANRSHTFYDKVDFRAEPVADMLDSLYILGAGKAGITGETLTLSLETF